MCTMFSSLQNLTKDKSKADWSERYNEAKKHIQFAVCLYEEQRKEGRPFLHEHPATATSWDLEELKKLEAKTGAHIHVADQCMYGLETWAGDKKR